MGGEALQTLALGERLAHEGEVEELEIPQAAVDELGGERGGGGGEVALVDEGDGEAAQGELARGAGARHSAADDDHVVVGVGQRAGACVRHDINSRKDGSTRSGPISAMRGSSARVIPLSTSTVARPSRLPMTMS